MSKRFQPLKEFGRIPKKPKLDITISKGRRTAAETEKQQQPQKSNFTDDLWNDDDDDVILLATQMVESEMASKEKGSSNTTPAVEMTESEITFSEFAPKIQQHSTQRPIPAKPADNDWLSQMFDDDDMDFIAVADKAEEAYSKNIPESEQLFFAESSEPVFKKPALPAPNSAAKTKDIPDIENERPCTSSSFLKGLHRTENEKPCTSSSFLKGEQRAGSEKPSPKASSSTLTSAQTTDPVVAARRQLASEKQIQFLMERLDALKKQNANLTKDLESVNERMLTKTGEASMLRDELKNVKQQMEGLKMEKMLHNEALAVQSQAKISELAKKVEAKETQLKLKNMECSVLKMKQADETRRFDTSMRGDISSADATTALEGSSDEEDTYNPMRLRTLQIIPLKPSAGSRSSQITDDIFKPSEGQGASKKRNTFFQKELEGLQRILAQIQMHPDNLERDTIELFTSSVQRVFSEFWSYTHTLICRPVEDVLPYHEYNIIEDQTTRPAGCLHKSTALYEDEHGINMRRYVATLSVICEESLLATYILLDAKKDDYPLLQIAIDAIKKMGFSEEITLHFGVLEAFASLSNSIFIHLDEEEEKNKPHAELLVSLIKQIVFTRPSPWVFYELSFSVLECVERWHYALELFCVNSSQKDFVAIRSKSVYRFSDESCFIQVYCGLIEASFPLYWTLNESQFELQAKLCLNHIRFVNYCFDECPHFVDKMLPYDEDDMEENQKDKSNESSSSSTSQIRKETPVSKAQSVLDEGPSTSKAAQARMSKSSNYNVDDDSATASKNIGATISNESCATANNSKNENTNDCKCFTLLCLSAVTCIYVSLRQWMRTDNQEQTDVIKLISKVGIHLLHKVFCVNYLACLFQEAEDTTKHYLYLICEWWTESAEQLGFNEIEMKLLTKFQKSSVIPKMISQMEPRIGNISADLKQWCRMANDHTIDPNNIDIESALKNLRIMEEVKEKFFEGYDKPEIKFEDFKVD